MYELHNFNAHRVEVTLPGNTGLLVLPADSHLPTEEHENAGLTVETFKDYVPSFLRPTAPAVRRRLLAKEGRKVPKSLIDSTAHLAEFGGMDGSPNPSGSPKVEAPAMTTFTAEEANTLTPSPPSAPSPPSPPNVVIPKTEDDLQKAADKACSSAAGKKGKSVSNPA